MVTIRLNDGTTITGLSMVHDTFYSPTEITAAMLNGKLCPVKISLSKDDNDGPVNQAWTGTIEYADVQSITQVNGKWAVKLKKLSPVKGLGEKMTVKNLRAGRLYTPFSVLNSYVIGGMKDGTKSLFLTFLPSYERGAHYHYNLRVHLQDQWGIDDRLSQKTLEYYVSSSGYSLQIVQSLSDDSPAITVEDNCVYLTPGYNGTGHPVYGYADVEQLSRSYESRELSGLYYTVNEELSREITEYLWN